MLADSDVITFGAALQKQTFTWFELQFRYVQVEQ